MTANAIHVGQTEPAGRRVVERLLGEATCMSAVHHANALSTNSLALDDLRTSPPRDDQLPRLYLADHQTAGRGRHGRTWLSNHGSLTFSLLVDWSLNEHPSSRLLSLVVGVAIARAIEFSLAPVQTRLKWPNDVYLDGGKVAGVLIETCQANAAGAANSGSHASQRRAVLGVGVNVNQAPRLDQQDMNAGDSIPARSISGVTGRQLNRYDMLEPLVSEIVDSLAALPSKESEFVDEFRNRCLLTGQPVRFQFAGEDVVGHCRGLSDDGELLVETDRGQQRLRSGEAMLLRVRNQSKSSR